MHSGGNRRYGRHMIIHNGQFAECEVLENFQGLCGPRTRTRTCKLVLKDKDFPRGLYNTVLIQQMHLTRLHYMNMI